MRSLSALVIASVSIAMIAPAPAMAGPSFGGGGFRSSPSISRPTTVRTSPPVARPSTTTTRTPTTSRPTTAPTSRRSGPFTYNGRQYTPTYDNGHLWLLYWVILNNGSRQQQRADCDHPRTTQERNACAEARRRT